MWLRSRGLSYEYLRLEFSQRSPSDHQKLPELSLGAARRAFRDIAGYRNRCALHLRHETEQFFTGKRLRQGICEGDQFHALLPHYQVMMRGRLAPHAARRCALCYDLSVTQYLLRISCHAFAVTKFGHCFSIFHGTSKYPVTNPRTFFRAAKATRYSPSGTWVPISIARTCACSAIGLRACTVSARA